MFAFLTAQTTATRIYEEKKEGTFRRLLAAPLGKWKLLAGKMLPNFVIAVLQVVIVVAASILLLPPIGQEAPAPGKLGARDRTQTAIGARELGLI